MVNTNVKNSFSNLLKSPPHKDITAINKFIVSGCFSRTTPEILEFIKRSGYKSDITSTFHYVKLIKEQLDTAKEKFGQDIEIEFFCDVAGTMYFEDFMHVYDKDSFYHEMVKFNPEFNFHGDLAKIKRRAFMALKDSELKKVGGNISIYLGALELALKKIGVDPEEEINGMSKSIVAMMYIMRAIGGIQIYLPKGDILNRMINEVDIYTDGYMMDSQSIARKYGVTFKTVSTVSKRVRDAIKEYEG